MLPGGDRTTAAFFFGMTGPAFADCLGLSVRYGIFLHGRRLYDRVAGRGLGREVQAHEAFIGPALA